ncbi:hypothetical protein FKP32DRAFT_518007 [Trametes sanguinea]|nr:hypothetical protein FKP32DRAFT_518007 [Trametes sanguinea]
MWRFAQLASIFSSDASHMDNQPLTAAAQCIVRENRTKLINSLQMRTTCIPAVFQISYVTPAMWEYPRLTTVTRRAVPEIVPGGMKCICEYRSANGCIAHLRMTAAI